MIPCPSAADAESSHRAPENADKNVGCDEDQQDADDQAVQTAQKRSDQMVSEASAQASRIKQKADEEIAQQKKKMLQDVRDEISDLAVEIASKVVEREISPRDYDGFVDEFIRNVGENN